MSATLTVFNRPTGHDETLRRTELYGTAKITGTYIAGGLLPNWNSLTFQNGENVLIDANTTGNVYQVTQVGVTSNSAIVLAQNSLTNGQYVTFNSVTANGAVLNGVTGIVSNASNVSFNFPVTTANFANVAVSGVAVQVIPPDFFHAETVAGSGYTYTLNQANATIQVFNGNTELANGSNITANVGVDVINFKAGYVRN